MDLAVGATQTRVMMAVLTKAELSKVVQACTYPVTGELLSSSFHWTSLTDRLANGCCQHLKRASQSCLDIGSVCKARRQTHVQYVHRVARHHQRSRQCQHFGLPGSDAIASRAYAVPCFGQFACQCPPACAAACTPDGSKSPPVGVRRHGEPSASQ